MFAAAAVVAAKAILRRYIKCRCSVEWNEMVLKMRR
jgi:hypothetical protein